MLFYILVFYYSYTYLAFIQSPNYIRKHILYSILLCFTNYIIQQNIQHFVFFKKGWGAGVPAVVSWLALYSIINWTDDIMEQINDTRVWTILTILAI